MILEFKPGKEGYKVMRGFEDRAKLVRAKVLTQRLKNCWSRKLLEKGERCLRLRT